MHFLLTWNVCLESANRSQEIIIAKSDSVLGFFCNNNKCSRPKNMEIGYLTLRLSQGHILKCDILLPCPNIYTYKI